MEAQEPQLFPRRARTSSCVRMHRASTRSGPFDWTHLGPSSPSHWRKRTGLKGEEVQDRPGSVQNPTSDFSPRERRNSPELSHELTDAWVHEDESLRRPAARLSAAMAPRSKAKKDGKRSHPPMPEVLEEDLVVSDEDMEFVRQHDVRFLDRLEQMVQRGEEDSQGKKKTMAKKDLEETYEKTSRKNKDWDEEEDKVPLQGGLPVKTLDGELRFDTEKALKELDRGTNGIGQETAVHQSGSTKMRITFQGASKRVEEAKNKADKLNGPSDVPKASTAAKEIPRKTNKEIKEEERARKSEVEEMTMLLQDRRFRDRRREELKETIATMSSKVLENPELRIGDLDELYLLTKDADPFVQDVAEVSLLAIFKDVCPGYRIRLPTEKELAVEVSKEVKKVRDFEATLLKHYSSFLKHLLQKGRQAENRAVGTMKARAKLGTPPKIIAVKCLGGLLDALPEFNFRTDILRALIPWASSVDSTVGHYCSKTIENVVRKDRHGQLSLEVVQLTAEVVKSRMCNASPRLLQPLLSLRMAEIPVHRADEDLEANPWKKGKKALKKERQKKAKGRKTGGSKDDLGFSEAQAEVDPAERGRLQSQALEAVFECFFRVVKDAGSDSGGVNGRWGQRPLLMVALQGISKFAHLISIEILADLLQVLLGLIKMQALGFSESLHVLLTSCEVLKGRGEALNVDASSLYECMYRVLAEAPLKSGAEIGLLPGENQETSVVEQNLLEELLASIMQKGIYEAPRALDLQKAAAFTKRLATIALHLPQGSTGACMATIRRILYRYSKVRCMLDSEATGIAGRYDWECDVPDQCGALGSTLWELSLLGMHYNPQIQKIARQIMQMDHLQSTSLSNSMALSSPVEACRQFSTSRGEFHPPIQPPPESEGRKMKAHTFGSSSTLLGSPMDPSLGIDARLSRAFEGAIAYSENRRLRREVALLQRKIELFQEHLASRPAKIHSKKRKASH
eukprot:scaffold659_cov318-Pavlova_lutheri.AAC.15